jgi:predicted CXXCH cytochrome family protein
VETPGTAIRAAWIFAAVALVALAVLLRLAALSAPVSADPSTPHLAGGVVTDTCAACHRSHSGQNDNLVESVPQSTLCFSCHDGTGSMYDVESEYADPSVPANDEATSSFYSHASASPSSHTSARADEFAGVLNRHAECADCHNPHSLTSDDAASTASGWLASGSLLGTAGVAATSPLTWKDPVSYEYELCLKCHSGYTQLLTYGAESEKKKDKAVEIDPTNASYHPVRAPGTNSTTEMENSLAGGTLWQFTTASTVRCVNCHANSGLLAGSPAWYGNLAPHASQNRGLLLANYRDRDLKPTGEGYDAVEFDLCFLCHSPAPFATGDEESPPRIDTNFQLHGFHMIGIAGDAGASLDIDTPGAGEGNAICAECHFDLHSTSLAPYAGNQDYSRGVNFAPNVEPLAPNAEPQWSGPTTRTCALVCHGESHDGYSY